MKAISTLTLLAVVAAFIAPNSAHAGDKEEAIIGGLIGGLIIGAVIADDDIDTHVSVGYRSGGHSRHNRGYWEWVSVKTWVPGYYQRNRDRHGRVCQTWVSGHFSYHKKKVWVDAHRRSSHGHNYGHHRGHRDSRKNNYDRRRDDRRSQRYDDRDNSRKKQIVRRF